jgi:hypothetical protein
MISNMFVQANAGKTNTKDARHTSACAERFEK